MSLFRAFPLVSALAALVLVMDAGLASANGLISATPAVHLSIPAGSTQSQLAEKLRALGYDAIKLSAVPAQPVDPHPELNPTLTDHPELTPVRSGWNGVAVKDGQLVQVFVDD